MLEREQRPHGPGCCRTVARRIKCRYYFRTIFRTLVFYLFSLNVCNSMPTYVYHIKYHITSFFFPPAHHRFTLLPSLLSSTKTKLITSITITIKIKKRRTFYYLGTWLIVTQASYTEPGPDQTRPHRKTL